MIGGCYKLAVVVDDFLFAVPILILILHHLQLFVVP